MSKNIILLDNFDSFTHNLLHLLQMVRPNLHIQILRNNNPSLLNQTPDAFIVGPGPMTPAKTGLLETYFTNTISKKQIPVLGICLGMQFLGWYFNIPVTRSSMPAHGTATAIAHNQTDIFKNIPLQMKGARYNSLEIQESQVNNHKEFTILATATENNAIMAMRHRTMPWVGVQFHPESFLTNYGIKVIDNFFTQYVEI